MELLSVKSDLAFRAVFGRDEEPCRQALTALLQDILEITIVQLAYVNPLNFQAYENDKASEMDIEIITDDGKRIGIEMQLLLTKGFKERMVYYCAKLVNVSLAEGEDYSLMRRSKLISLVDFVLFEENQRIMNRFTFREGQDCFELSGIAEIIFLEMGKLTEKPVTEMCRLEKWLYFLRHAGDSQRASKLREIIEESEGIRMAYEVLLKVSADDQMRTKIRLQEKAERDRRSQMLYVRDEALKEGIEQVARNLLRDGVELAYVVKVTGLSIEELKQLI